MGKLSDIALISQVVLFNDKNAYGELVERYQDTVRRFLIHLCGDADLAYDLAQETFIKAYISIGSFQGL
ncbi:MAG: sigma factor, partial [Bacteroidales bacterium]